MTEAITQEAIERIAKQAIDFMYRYLQHAGGCSPKMFIDELGSADRAADLQTMEEILVDFLASVAYGKKLVTSESEAPND
ncbi:MAG: hypothetical protein HC781_22710 [Leptolyngbyaceae cyanobacterium CSU_1_4]|nr:hypothetical protein [Leptolyngbyaceae cyanobacterium CSU_1_4]